MYIYIYIYIYIYVYIYIYCGGSFWGGLGNTFGECFATTIVGNFVTVCHAWSVSSIILVTKLYWCNSFASCEGLWTSLHIQ